MPVYRSRMVAWWRFPHESRCSTRSSPIVHGAVFQPVYGQARAAIGISRGQGFVDLDAEARRVTRMQITCIEAVGMREDGVGLGGVTHIFLNSQIRHTK